VPRHGGPLTCRPKAEAAWPARSGLRPKRPDWLALAGVAQSSGWPAGGGEGTVRRRKLTGVSSCGRVGVRNGSEGRGGLGGEGRRVPIMEAHRMLVGDK
jgi:hypothetical protein